MLYCYDLDNGVTIINSETLEKRRVSYTELFEMYKRQEYVEGIYTDYKENGYKIDVEGYSIEYTCDGYVRDVYTGISGAEYDIETKTFIRTEGEKVVYKGTKLPIKFRVFACTDFSVTLEDVIIVRTDKYCYEVWYKGKYAKFYTDQIRGIYRVPKCFGDIFICRYRGSGVTDVIPLERYVSTNGVSMLYLDFMLKHKLV